MNQKWIVPGVNRNLHWFFNFQNASLMRCCHCHFPCVQLRWKHIGEITFIGEISFAASLFPIGSVAELLIPIGPFFLAPTCFSSCYKTIRGSERNSKVCLRLSNMACLFVEIYWSLVEVILLYVSWRNTSKRRLQKK